MEFSARRQHAFTALMQHPASLALLLANFVGAPVYVALASMGWTIPEERAAIVRGDIAITGEPFIWAMAILPVVAVFAPINIVWAWMILARRHWASAKYFVACAAVWLMAVTIDFANH